jgi:rRNA maturation endonuclease Nob1
MIDAIAGTIPVYNMNGRCDGCGEELHDDWKFCPYCGAPIHYQNDYWGKLNWKDLSK